MDQKKKNLLNRAAFGLYPDNPSGKLNFNDLLKTSAGQKNIDIVGSPWEEGKPDKDDPAKRKEQQQKIRQQTVQLNTTWIEQMKDPALVVREKMTFFWHDHFACRVRNPFLMQQQNNTIRKHALEKFSDLLMAISKDPAMLQFLNNQQNKKDSPNENFAREVMELFTLGRGHYNENDIKQAARAFTGWGFNPLEGTFVFRPRQHDTGTKTFRGKSGNFSGEDIIAMILEDRQTAEFITQKLWQFFVAPGNTDKTVISELSREFYSSGYDTGQLLRNIFSGKLFDDDVYTGNRVKSPVELIVGIIVHTGGKFNNPGNLLYLQKALGQVLFQPPNVGGWPVDKEWIDSSSLAFRMSLPSILLRDSDSETEVVAKDDGDVNNVTNAFDKAGKISFTANWQVLGNAFMKTSAIETAEAVENYLLVKPTTAANRKMVLDLGGGSKEDTEFIKKLFIGFMSLPDYQLS